MKLWRLGLPLLLAGCATQHSLPPGGLDPKATPLPPVSVEAVEPIDGEALRNLMRQSGHFERIEKPHRLPNNLKVSGELHEDAPLNYLTAPLGGLILFLLPLPATYTSDLTFELQYAGQHSRIYRYRNQTQSYRWLGNPGGKDRRDNARYVLDALAADLHRNGYATQSPATP